ncbi:hypothetical protein MUB24_06810 [Lederbergia sp. NSJ-179]|uniref:hypothetical protein n=1 Tax=Lederbergia sp. NSJ-179 TaxID=2931402 RepID=UPI001FD062E9|nr:hypothetical protein [Lederbergia sp. NSJ-179]MCJ7840621.1 hypothetical protein [Lederbergia sp. NSJ-179]
MIYEWRILKGLFHPNQSFYKLAKAEVIEGWRLRIFLLLLASAVIFSLSGWVGIGSHVLSPTLLGESPIEYESVKGLFVIGRFLFGLVYGGMILTLPALCFWLFSEDLYSKFVVIQSFILPILLLEQVSFIILAIGFDLPWYSSPLSLGVIGQYLFTYKYAIFLLGSISIFKVWVMVLQYRGIRTMTSLKRIPLFLIVLGVHLVSWCLSSAMAVINFVILL